MPASQKTPLAASLNAIAHRKALEVVQHLGKALPCSVTVVSGSIVTVKFEVTGPYTLQPVTMPIFGPEYIRYPIQVGCLGVTFPIDVYLGGISGLGGGTADMTMPQANLSNLVFLPCGSKNWSATDDANAVVIYGPDGAIIRDTGKTTTLKIAPNAATLTATTFTINGNVVVNGKITSTGDIAGAGISLDTHVHSGVQSGSSNTGGPVS